MLRRIHAAPAENGSACRDLVTRLVTVGSRLAPAQVFWIDDAGRLYDRKVGANLKSLDLRTSPRGSFKFPSQKDVQGDWRAKKFHFRGVARQRQAQLTDMQHQRDELAAERTQAHQQLQALSEKGELDRETAETYLRGVEDRAHREVDHARVETKEGNRKIKELARQLEQLQRRLDDKHGELSVAQQTAAAQQARAETLDAQLNRQTLAAAQRKTKPTKKPTVRRSPPDGKPGKT